MRLHESTEGIDRVYRANCRARSPGKVIVELKAVSEVADIYHEQLLSYLKATGLRLGILVNFGSKRLECWRLVN